MKLCGFEIGLNQPLFLIAGTCSIEGLQMSIDTAGTLVKAAVVLKQRGAKNVYAYCSHPIFSGPALERIGNGAALDEVVVTNTIPLSAEAQKCSKIRQLSVAGLIAETIHRISTGDSVSSLFTN